MKKLILLLIISVLLSSQLFVATASAQGFPTLIPSTALDGEQCKAELLKLDTESAKSTKSPIDLFKAYPAGSGPTKDDILACGIKTGRISFWMIPYYIVFFIEFLIAISGIVAILFLIIAGYQFIISGATDKRESAKTTIMHALLGLVVVALAWVIVNIIQFVLTI